MSAVIISSAISYIGFTISAFIVFTTITLLNVLYYDSPICSIIIAALEFFLIHMLFRMKRLKDGFQFISNKSQNDYIDIFILILSIILIFLYFYIGNYNNITLPYLFTGLFLFVLIVIPLLQRSFNIYHKQKLQTKALKDYEQELSETKQKLATALEEKQKLVKSNHEFYHRQAALNKKLDDLRNQNQLISNAEFAEEYSNILNRINNLSAEYDIKTYTIPNLTKT
ncbi:MAG: hypothetical protein IKO49_08525, partial [Bacilli bacterium]|nr:hypothetical protein [Bacilli bacterium]